MRWIRFTILILVAAILQTSLVQLLALTEAEIKPNLLLILLVYFSVYANGADGIITSFAIGLCADLIGSGVGPQMVSFGLTGSLLTEIRKLIDLRPILNQIIVVVLAGMLSGLLTLPLYAVKGCPSPAGHWPILLWEPLYSSLLAPLLFWVINVIMGHSANRQRPMIS